VDPVVITSTLNELLHFRIGSNACASENSSTYDDDKLIVLKASTLLKIVHKG
jgi:hypothetical protein